MVGQLHQESGFTTFKLPLTYVPKYISADKEESKQNDEQPNQTSQKSKTSK